MTALNARLPDGLDFSVEDIVADVCCRAALIQAVNEFDHAHITIFFKNRLRDLAQRLLIQLADSSK